MSMFNVDVYFLRNEKTKAHSAFANCRAGETWQIPIWFELACVCVRVCVCARAHMVEGIGPAPRQRALEMCRTQAVVFPRLPLSLSLSRLPPWPHISPVTAARAGAKHKQRVPGPIGRRPKRTVCNAGNTLSVLSPDRKSSFKSPPTIMSLTLADQPPYPG